MMTIYKISQGYSRCVLYHADDKTHRRVGTSTITPNKELTRRQKYEVIAEYLVERSGLPRPDYDPLKGEQ